MTAIGIKNGLCDILFKIFESIISFSNNNDKIKKILIKNIMLEKIPCQAKIDI